MSREELHCLLPGGRGGGWEDERKENRECTPTCHTQEVPQEVKEHVGREEEEEEEVDGGFVEEKGKMLQRSEVSG